MKSPAESPSVQGGAKQPVVALILASTALQAFAFAVPGDVLALAARGGGIALLVAAFVVALRIRPITREQ